MQETHRQIWSQIAKAIEREVSADAFKRWFAEIELVKTDENHLHLRVPNQIYQLWIESNYSNQVQAGVMLVLGSPKRLIFSFRDAEIELPPPPPVAPAPGDTKPVADLDTQIQEEIAPTEVTSPNGLNPRNTFDSFVVGQNNQFAHAASLAVAQSPAKTYNPLFIYGGVGLGKTHLMQAIGQFVIGRKKNIKVMYLSSERFTNEFIDAIQNSSLVKFRKRYRMADVLLIDDIQFLAGKERSQEEFFHTFNALFDGHKQIILSSDRPANEISNLEQRLVSRFEWGLTAELQPPDVETRHAILRKKSEALQITLTRDILDFLAQRIRSNVRRLEGALMRVASFVSLSGREITTEAVEHLLKDILQEEARRSVNIDQIQRKVAEHFDVRMADMTSKRRPAHIAFPRQVAMFLSREMTKCSLNEIGDAFGGRDHGTVLHAHKLVKKKIGADEHVRQLVLMLEAQLQR